MEHHLIITGILLSVLSLIHIAFPQYFKWETELNGLSLINRQMMTIHTFFIALMVLLMGILCVTSANELLATPLGKKVSFGLGVFWTIRLFIQFFGYSPQLWRGKRFETAVHIFFSLLWFYFSFIFLAAAW